MTGTASKAEISPTSENLFGCGPKNILCTSQRMYPAVKTTPNAANAVGQPQTSKVPINIVISDTKPLVPGNPSEAIPARINIQASTGILAANPPRSGMYLV